jgi:hypothetical protein
MITGQINEQNNNRRARRAAVAAIDAMIAARPLRPPPLPRNLTTPTAGALSLARESRAGHYRPAGPVWR